MKDPHDGRRMSFDEYSGQSTVRIKIWHIIKPRTIIIPTRFNYIGTSYVILNLGQLLWNFQLIFWCQNRLLEALSGIRTREFPL